MRILILIKTHFAIFYICSIILRTPVWSVKNSKVAGPQPDSLGAMPTA